jgi:hypothetical protein
VPEIVRQDQDDIKKLEALLNNLSNALSWLDVPDQALDAARLSVDCFRESVKIRNVSIRSSPSR